MKKLACLLLSIILMFGLAACENDMVEGVLTSFSSLNDQLNAGENDSTSTTETSAGTQTSGTTKPTATTKSSRTTRSTRKTETTGTTESTDRQIVPTQSPATNVVKDFEPITDNGFSQGNGTQTNPYVITTADQLVYFSEQVNTGNLKNGVYVALGADIDMTGVAFSPIGNDAHRFSACFDGKGFTVSNLTPSLIYKDFGNNANYHCGFFGIVENAEIKNLCLENVNITYSYDSNYFTEIGLLAACVYPTRECKITDCVVNGTMKVDTNTLLAGGVVGSIFVNNGASLECKRIQSNTTLQVRSDSTNAGAFAGSVLGRGEESFSDICVQSEILHSSTYSSYVGAFGGVANSKGTMSVSNCFININTRKSIADHVHPLIGGIIDSYEPSGTFKFTNVFGFADSCTQLYEIPSENPVNEENCAFTDVLPSECHFSTDVWDMTDPAAPFINFNFR